MTSNVPFNRFVDLPESAIRQYEHIFFLRNFLQRPDLFKEEVKEIEKSVVQELPAIEEDVQQIECYDPKDFPAEKLREILAKDVRPIVIRGFANQFDCVKQWTPEMFMEKYGDFKIWYSSTEELFVEDGTRLGDYVKSVLDGNINRAYLENLSDIFNAHPELHQQAGLDKIGEYLGDVGNYHRIAQLFIGGPGTGAVYHCANELNCFLNIYGQKKWTFAHPKYSAAMYTSNFNKGIFVGSLVKHKAPKRFIETEFPLYNRIPKLTITLEPGDMLINPPWWWHAVDNISPVSIAIATRWEILVENQRQNPLYDFVQSFRTERLSIEGKKMSESDVVVPDNELRKKYVSYSEMGWQS